MLTHDFVISNWEHDWNGTYYIFTDDGDAIVYHPKLRRFFYEGRFQIDRDEVCERLNY